MDDRELAKRLDEIQEQLEEIRDFLKEEIIDQINEQEQINGKTTIKQKQE